MGRFHADEMTASLWADRAGRGQYGMTAGGAYAFLQCAPQPADLERRSSGESGSLLSRASSGCWRPGREGSTVMMLIPAAEQDWRRQQAEGYRARTRKLADRAYWRDLDIQRKGGRAGRVSRLPAQWVVATISAFRCLYDL